jgi:hypothetical protein
MNGEAKYIEMLLEGRLLQEREARGYLEHIEKNIYRVSHCGETHHPGELSQYESGHHLEVIEATSRNKEEDEATGVAGVEEASQPRVLGGLLHRRSSVRDTFL